MSVKNLLDLCDTERWPSDERALAQNERGIDAFLARHGSVSGGDPLTQVSPADEPDARPPRATAIRPNKARAQPGSFPRACRRIRKSPGHGGSAGAFGVPYGGNQAMTRESHRSRDLVTSAVMFQPLRCDFFPHPDCNPPLEMSDASVSPCWPFALVIDFFRARRFDGGKYGEGPVCNRAFLFFGLAIQLRLHRQSQL
jgi:hypothetical protein